MFRPSDGEYSELHLQLGDLLLVASDGLFDNLYEDFIVQILNNHLVGCDEIACLSLSTMRHCSFVLGWSILSGIFRKRLSNSCSISTPRYETCWQSWFLGGLEIDSFLVSADIKRDDILVLLFRVVPCSSLSNGKAVGNNKSASCSSSDSSLSCLLIEQEEQEPLDLFIFQDWH